jgi:hypothetical protein
MFIFNAASEEVVDALSLVSWHLENSSNMKQLGGKLFYHFAKSED